MSFLLLIFMNIPALAAENLNIPQVGPHFPILTVEKNENPQNILIVYTKMDKDCHFLTDPKDPSRPLLGFYWLMDHTRYKPVHAMIQSGIRKRLELEKFTRAQVLHHSFSVRLNEVHELDSRIESAEMNVTSQVTPPGSCAVDVLLSGLDHDPKTPFHLTSLYSDSRKTFWPPFRKLNAVTLNGLDLSTGEKISRTISAQH